MNSGSQPKTNILKNRRALNDEWRLNGPHRDYVTNKINIQNDFQSLVYCSEDSKWFSIEHFVWINSNKNLLTVDNQQLWLMFYDIKEPSMLIGFPHSIFDNSQARVLIIGPKQVSWIKKSEN